MTQVLSRLLIIALLFGSAEAAVDSMHIDGDHDSGNSHMLHDHDDPASDVDHNEDNCNHYCHCTHQMGALFTHTSSIFHTYYIETASHFYRYRYQPLSSLFRPPIS